MRLQTESAPNPADRHAAEPRGLGQTARAPMRLRARRTFQSPNHNLLHLRISDFAGRSRSRLVIESFQASLQKSRAPLAHHAERTAQSLGHGVVSQPSAQASTTRARRARSGWLRARWDKDWS